MANQNIEIKQMNGSGTYDILYPKTLSTNTLLSNTTAGALGLSSGSNVDQALSKVQLNLNKGAFSTATTDSMLIQKLGETTNMVTYTVTVGDIMQVPIRNIWYDPNTSSFYAWNAIEGTAANNTYPYTVNIYSTKDNVTWTKLGTHSFLCYYDGNIYATMTDTGRIIIALSDSYTSKTLYYSDNYGVTFTKGSTISSSYNLSSGVSFYGVHGGAIFTHLGSSTHCYYFTTGESVTSLTHPVSTGYGQLLRFKTTYIMVYTGNGGWGSAYYSTNGTTWNEITACGTAAGTSSYDAGYKAMYVTKNAVILLWNNADTGSDYLNYCGTYAYTTNGTSWTKRTCPNTYALSSNYSSDDTRGINEYFLIETKSSTSSSTASVYYKSSNGTSWTTTSYDCFNRLYKTGAKYLGVSKWMSLESKNNGTGVNSYYYLRTSEDIFAETPKNTLSSISGTALNSPWRMKSYKGNGATSLSLTFDAVPTVVIITPRPITPSFANSDKYYVLITPMMHITCGKNTDTPAKGLVTLSNNGKTWSMATVGTFNTNNQDYYAYYL